MIDTPLTHKREPKPHDFKLDVKNSREKGKLFKLHGLYQISDVSKFVYHCDVCDTTVEYPGKADVRSINIQVAQKATCI